MSINVPRKAIQVGSGVENPVRKQSWHIQYIVYIIQLVQAKNYLTFDQKQLFMVVVGSFLSFPELFFHTIKVAWPTMEKIQLILVLWYIFLKNILNCEKGPSSKLSKAIKIAFNLQKTSHQNCFQSHKNCVRSLFILHLSTNRKYHHNLILFGFSRWIQVKVTPLYGIPVPGGRESRQAAYNANIGNRKSSPCDYVNPETVTPINCLAELPGVVVII